MKICSHIGTLKKRLDTSPVKFTALEIISAKYSVIEWTGNIITLKGEVLINTNNNTLEW